ncbi:MAG TPA: hypothetical protein VFL62_21525 [Bradyrhizobium sp.]|uniref:hypothetical protein n=1 Tax=Bradyrhizobium sp. TaxID=376 RepID=UPI002D7FB63E|nr:hypothetical protein [Bradyrhizobium sp.]HET7888813.1 hypothetical protein [Bradyrhizobium sp.]
MLTLPCQSLAQQAPDWGQWEEAAKGSDNFKPLPGIGYGSGVCQGYQLAGKHVYWRCMPRCKGSAGVVGDFCWEAVSDAIYTCPAPAKGFRQAEKIRYSNVRCGKKDWLVTKRLADSYEETWQKRVEDPPELTSETPPQKEDDLPTTSDGTKLSWGGSGPPWAPQEAEKKDDAKTETGKTDTGKLDTPKTDTPKTDTPKTDTPKTDTAKTDTKTDTGPKTATGGGSSTTPSNAKKGNKKEVRNKGGGRTIDRSRGGDDIDPDTAAAIGMGVMYGLGGFGRGHMGGDRMGGDRMGGSRMMDR